MTDNQQPKQRGGSRVGAGRKPLNESGAKVQFATWLPSEIVSHIQKQPNQAEYLQRLVELDMNKPV